MRVCVPVFLALIVPSFAQAATYVVDPYGGGDFTTLSAAISAANDHDVLFLSAGNHVLPSQIVKPLDFMGTLTSQTIVSGNATLFADTKLSNVTFDASSGALRIEAADLELNGVRFSGAASNAVGGALEAQSATVTIDSCEFIGNAATTGAHLHARMSSLTVTNSLFADGSADQGAVSLDDSEWFADTVEFSNNAATQGGAIYAVNSWVESLGALYSENSANDSGGALYLTASLLLELDANYSSNLSLGNGGAILSAGSLGAIELHNGEFNGNSAGTDGGAIAANNPNGSVTLDWTNFYDNTATWNGGALAVVDGSTVFIVDHAIFQDNEAYRGGAAYLKSQLTSHIGSSSLNGNEAKLGGAIRWFPGGVGNGTLDLAGNNFSQNSALDEGGALSAVGGGLVSLSGNRFGANLSPTGSAILLDRVPHHTATDNRFCQNGGGVQTAAVHLMAEPTSTFQGEWVQNQFWGSQGSIRQDGGILLTIENNVFTHDGGPAVLALSTSSILRNNIVAYNAGVGIQSTVAQANTSYNLLYQNNGGDLSFYAPNNVFADPLLVAHDACDADLRPRWGSPVIDAGAPDTFDPDGSVADIGLFGGPGAPDLLWVDADSDEVPALYDCDDASAAASPALEEVPYDGIDQDCSGSDLCDVDMDGVNAPECSGEDCDDLDPTVHPNAAEVWYDGIDQNCDDLQDSDQDGDGYAAVAAGGNDCDDLEPDVHPNQTEIWYDGVDQDCDGNDADQDGDGFEGGYGDDCDDTNAGIYPGAEDDPYDSEDTDCSGNDSYDLDYDGYDSIESGGADCDDSDPTVHPNANEIWYDGTDQDCDGNDNDQDYDGIPVGDDCDDTWSVVYPGATDATGDGIDADCDGVDGADVEDGLEDSPDKVHGGCQTASTQINGWMLIFALPLLRRKSRRSPTGVLGSTQGQ